MATGLEGLMTANGAPKSSHGAAVQMWSIVRDGRVADRCRERGIPWRVVPVRWHRSKLKRTGELARLA